MFLYKDKPITDVGLRQGLAGRESVPSAFPSIGGAIAMKIVGRKSERKYQRYNTVDQRIRFAVLPLAMPEPFASGFATASACLSNGARSSVG